MANHIKCAECRYAVVDKKASEYTLRRCKDCELNTNCTCKKKECKCGKGCKYRKDPDTPCPKQDIKWAAYQCACSDSEFHKGLLNVTPNGDKQSRITWIGCEYGERRLG